MDDTTTTPLSPQMLWLPDDLDSYLYDEFDGCSSSSSDAPTSEEDNLQAIMDLLAEEDNGDQDGCAWFDALQLEQELAEAQATLPVATPAAARPRGPQRDSVKKHRKKESGSTRVRNQVLQLRVDAKELEQRLKLLRSRHGSGTATGTGTWASRHMYRPSSTSSLEEADTKKSQRPFMWKTIAQRQYRAMCESQSVNEQLRSSVEEHRKMAQQFMRSLNRGTARLPMNGGSSSEPSSFSGGHIQGIVDYDACVEATECSALLDQVDFMLQNLDGAFQDPCFHRDEPVSKQATTRADGSISVVDVHTVPLDYQATGDAIWNYYADRTTEPTTFPHIEHVGENLMIKGFRMTLGSSLQLGHVQGTIVGRRMVDENNRMAIVWAANITPIVEFGGFFKSQAVDLLSFHANGWMTIADLPTTQEDSQRPMSKICMNFSVSSSSHGTSKLPRRGVMAEMVKRLVVQGIGEHQETIHRRVDDACVGVNTGGMGNSSSTDSTDDGPNAEASSSRLFSQFRSALQSW